jgi:hypothetical protein
MSITGHHYLYIGLRLTQQAYKLRCFIRGDAPGNAE